MILLIQFLVQGVTIHFKLLKNFNASKFHCHSPDFQFGDVSTMKIHQLRYAEILLIKIQILFVRLITHIGGYCLISVTCSEFGLNLDEIGNHYSMCNQNFVAIKDPCFQN